MKSRRQSNFWPYTPIGDELNFWVKFYTTLYSAISDRGLGLGARPEFIIFKDLIRSAETCSNQHRVLKLATVDPRNTNLIIMA